MFKKDKKNNEAKEKQEEIDDKVFELLEKGWIKCHSFIELMAVKKDVVEEHLTDHMKKIKNEEGLFVTREEYQDIIEIDNPPGQADTAYSQIVETEIVFRNFAMLVYFVTNYGPSSLEILEPKEIKMGQGEATSIANALASLVHQFASQGVGGIVFSKK